MFIVMFKPTEMKMEGGEEKTLHHRAGPTQAGNFH